MLGMVTKNTCDRLHLIAIFSLLVAINCQDVCNNYKSITGEEKRSPDYIFDYAADTAISDDRLTAGWYRIQNNAGEDMPTSAPGTFRCGTFYPIWLNGEFPKKDETVSIPVCVETTSTPCHRTWNIQIKRCATGYLVYELKTSLVSNSAYCFGRSLTCPNGTSSETGFAPCKTDFPAITLTPEVGEMGKAISPLGNLDPVFRCNFDDSGYGYLYDVYWYVDIHEDIVKEAHNVNISKINYTDLQPKDWIKAYPVNNTIKCSVRARYNVGSTPGYKFYSASYVVILMETPMTTDTESSSPRLQSTTSHILIPISKESENSDTMSILIVILGSILGVTAVIVIGCIIVKKRKSRVTVKNKEPMYVEFGKKDENHTYERMKNGRLQDTKNTNGNTRSSDVHDYDVITSKDNSGSNEKGYAEFVGVKENHAYDSLDSLEGKVLNEKKNTEEYSTIDEIGSSLVVVSSDKHLHDSCQKTASNPEYTNKTSENIHAKDKKTGITNTSDANPYDIIS